MSEITPEKVAAAVCEGFGGWRDSLTGALSVTAEGNMLSLAVARWDADDTETVRHFRAVVVEGESVPLGLDRERYRNAVEEIVKAFSTALASSALEMYPYHLARLKGALRDLAEAAQAENGGAQ